MVTVSTSAASYHHGDLRSALINAGLAALEKAEAPDLSLRELARDVGVSATAVYRHFPNKDALLAELSKVGLEMLGGSQKEAADAAGGGREGFAAAGRQYVRFALANPALFRLVFAYGRPPKREVGEADPARKLLYSYATELSGDTGEKAERLALQSWSIAHGIAMLMLDGRIPADATLIDGLLDGDGLLGNQGSNSDESP